MKKAAIKINESALIKNLRFAFSNAFTVVTELLQNGRRAGATQVDITIRKEGDENVLTVVDNGSGISDFQKLLTVAESGWDAETTAEESPFGMGFLSALFSARRVVVQSNGHTLDMDTEHMLSMQDVHILPVSEHLGQGTSVSLYGVSDKAIQEGVIGRLVRGFNITVTLNGVMLERPYALNDSFVQTSEGKLNLDMDKLLSQSHFSGVDINLFLQGFRVSEVAHWHSYVATIHLDPTKYFGRMPDRDKLVDEKSAYDKCFELVIGMAKAHLAEKFKEMTQEEFFSTYGSFIMSNALEFLNMSDTLLPACALSRPEGISKYSDRMTFEAGRNITREAIESGQVLLFTDKNYIEESVDELVWQFIYHNDNCYLVDKLPKGHWAKEYVLDEPEDDDNITLQAVNPGKQGELRGGYVATTVTLCDAVELTFSNGTCITVNNCCVFDPMHGIFAPVQKNGGIPSVATCLEVAEEYSCDDNFAEGEHDEDMDRLSRLISNLASQDFATAVAGAVAREDIALQDGVQGKQFLVRISSNPSSNYYDKKNNVNAVDFDLVMAKLGISAEDVEKAVSTVLAEKQQPQE